MVFLFSCDPVCYVLPYCPCATLYYPNSPRSLLSFAPSWHDQIKLYSFNATSYNQMCSLRLFHMSVLLILHLKVILLVLICADFFPTDSKAERQKTESNMAAPPSPRSPTEALPKHHGSQGRQFKNTTAIQVTYYAIKASTYL